MRRLKLLIVTVILIMVSSCSSPSDPPPAKKIIREYTWTADTLQYENAYQTLLGNIWGDSGDNIYLSGHSTRTAGCLWRYNGVEWRNINLNDYEGIGSYSLNQIDGSSSDNIWVVGRQSDMVSPSPPTYVDYNLVIRFDGQKWIEEKIRIDEVAYCVKVISRNDVWVGGWNGVVYHYQDDKWALDTIKVEENEILVLENIVHCKNQLYLSAVLRDKTSQRGKEIQLYKYQSDKWEKIKSYKKPIDSTNWDYSLSVGKDGEMYTGGNGIYRYNSGNWEKLYDTPTTYTNKILADNNGNILATSYTSLIHYNGVDWLKIPFFEEKQIPLVNVWMDSDEIFVTGYIFHEGKDKTVIYHGK